MNIVERVARQIWKPPSRVPPWKWAEQHIVVDKTSPFPGQFRSDTAPWTRELMEVFADNSIRDISVMCSAQSAKTQTIMILASWAIAEDPGPMMWVMAAQDEAKTFARTRLMPTFEQCEPIAKQLGVIGRFDKSTLEINFPNAPLIVNGANSQSKLQSKPIRWLFLDEVRNYPPGAYEMVLKRTTAFWNARRVTISTPDMVDDAVHRAYLAGDQRRFYICCPKCAQEQQLKFSQIKWDENEHTRPNGEWNFDRLEPTIRYECCACGHRIHDTFAERRLLAINGRWVKHNKNAPANRVSFTWSALLPPWIRWRTIVEEFLRAQEALAAGASEPLKAFVNETLGEPWEEAALFGRELKPGLAYRKGEAWDKEHIRFMTVDKQKDCYWFVVRAWSASGSSRLLAEGRLQTWDDVRETQMRMRVTDRCTVIDSGYNATEVYEKCCDFGWTAFKGEDRENFPHWAAPDVRLLRAFSAIQAGDPGLGTVTQGMRACPLFLWSNPTVKDILYRLKGGHGLSWELPSDVSPEYLAQMNSEAKVRVVNRAGFSHYEWRVIGKRANHLWDCECMQLVCAMMADLVPQLEAKPKSEEKSFAE